eukprot:733452-Amphidinium_carterae.1
MSSKKINKKFSIQTEEKPNSGSIGTKYEEPQEEVTAQETVNELVSNVPFTTVQTYYPGPGGMRSRPYPITEGRPYP